MSAVSVAAPLLSPDAVSSSRSTQVFSGQLLRLPRFLEKPRIFHLSPTDTVTIYRTPADTCGLYTWGVFTVSDGKGPVPHIHYADQEWFLSEGQGGIRIFLPREPVGPMLPGQVPGLNAPIQVTGSALLSAYEAMYSPQGVVHYYTNESGRPVGGFHNVWAPGYGMIGVFDVFDQAVKAGRQLTQQDLMAKTGLWGTPHDSSGAMVGTRDYRAIRGPIAKYPANLQQLQELIDDGERCFHERQP